MEISAESYIQLEEKIKQTGQNQEDQPNYSSYQKRNKNEKCDMAAIEMNTKLGCLKRSMVSNSNE